MIPAGVLGRVADAWSYPASYVAARPSKRWPFPFLWLARRQRAPSDGLESGAPSTGRR